jgi:uncharacterized protein (TIGR02996 family)
MRTTEDAFLDQLRQNPADETARAVYADWLDEQDTEESRARAAFIRLETALATLPPEPRRQQQAQHRLQELALQTDPSWLTVVSHPFLEECRLEFAFECPKSWAKLEPTDQDNVRFCGECKKNVYYCDSIGEARNHAWNGDCVAVSAALTRTPGDLDRQELVTMGIMLPPRDFEREAEEESSPSRLQRLLERIRNRRKSEE